MTLGEKIAKLRKEENYTQEQLAEILCVSRQSVSKWESDIAYPETETLIELGKIFNCSMDYLLRDEITQKTKGKISEIARNVLNESTKKRFKYALKIAAWIISIIIIIDVISFILYYVLVGLPQ